MLLGWLQKRRQARAKSEALKIGTAVVARVNAGIELWKVERLSARFEMLCNSFDERLVALEPADGLSFEETAEIEAIAFIKNWVGRRDEYAVEALSYMSEDDMDCLDVIGAGERGSEIIYEAIHEVTKKLDAHASQAIAEAVAMRAKRTSQ